MIPKRKYWLVYSISVINFCLFPSTNGMGYIWGREQPSLQNHTVNMYILESVSVPTLTSCGHACHVNKLCMSFFFNKISSACRLHSVMFPYDAPWQPGVGWKYYQIYEDECMPDHGYVHNRHLGSCYKFHHLEDQRTLHDAEDFCAEQGSQLMRVDDEDKQIHVAGYLAFFPNHKVYIQGSNVLTEGIWRYDDGFPMTYTNWSPGEPGGKDYIVISNINGYFWEAVDGTEPHGFFCEKCLSY